MHTPRLSAFMRAFGTLLLRRPGAPECGSVARREKATLCCSMKALFSPRASAWPGRAAFIATSHE